MGSERDNWTSAPGSRFTYTERKLAHIDYLALICYSLQETDSGQDPPRASTMFGRHGYLSNYSCSTLINANEQSEPLCGAVRCNCVMIAL